MIVEHGLAAVSSLLMVAATHGSGKPKLHLHSSRRYWISCYFVTAKKLFLKDVLATAILWVQDMRVAAS